MSPRVFIPHIPVRRDPIGNRYVPAIDLNPAKQYGELIQCLPLGFNPNENLEVAASRVMDVVMDKQNSIQHQDYILVAGDVVCCSFAIQASLEETGQAVLLRWDRGDHKYRKSVIKEDNINDSLSA